MRNGSISNDGCSSSTSLSSQQDVEDDRMIAVVLSEEYAKLDGAVGRRISSLAPVPHIPRINLHFPSSSDSNLDYQRLLQRLKVYGLYEVKVSGDGNCQFRALSDQIYRSPEYHKHVRKEVVKQFAAKICLLTSFRDTCFVEIVPRHQVPVRELWLSFWSEVHYNSLYELKDAPLHHKPRRKHWLF
ncbi:UNVERIFIED_CONTAM: OVARIAN TUMOR DOMAIN-containing deubiquitinating enzyme 12 [Sesamum angustifolium]|uniref:OVARIAN TUMOR DOMAIN-containing deubiquitinating enzyme 12 n=1 Tax=Sesamum angustifolium TaxID=2727405 RepID=A0AAW2NMH0_9LAMI